MDHRGLVPLPAAVGVSDFPDFPQSSRRAEKRASAWWPRRRRMQPADLSARVNNVDVAVTPGAQLLRRWVEEAAVNSPGGQIGWSAASTEGHFHLAAAEA